jgi:hypothetical protein
LVGAVLLVPRIEYCIYIYIEMKLAANGTIGAGVEKKEVQ